jgi:hypothetical protein
VAKFLYSCRECGAPAKKEPLKARRDWKIADAKDFGGLGGWKCTNRCRGKIKVTRKPAPKQERKAA